MKPLNLFVVTWSLATFCALSFTICVIYGLLTPHSLHMHEFLEMALPAYEWGSFPLFFVGLVESFLYGAYAGLVYVPIYNFFLKKWEPQTTPPHRKQQEFPLTSKTEMDPVCGMWIETEEATFTSFHNGETYYFCAKECKGKFDQNPDFHMKGFEGRKP